jgi:hypothetical protein
VAGYSGTPLAAKLGLREGTTLALLGAPADFVIELPEHVTVKRQARGTVDVALAFFSQDATFTRRLDALGKMAFPSGDLWIAWPKKASGMPTDLTDHVIRREALPKGLVDNKVCAVDDTWSALRLVWRLENRPGSLHRARL